MPASLGTLKQEIMKIYNSVNQKMFFTGVKRQRVDIVGNKIVILAEHQRIRALLCLDESDRQISRLVDVALLDKNKERLKTAIEENLNLKIKTILKDYDPVSEIAGTIIVLEEVPAGLET
ncbi:MAG: DUF2294 family protein [Thermoanaerobacteraceae bacterium]|nr:DUF2294 family protein [Thermoanaerobacteraceae bacterium]